MLPADTASCTAWTYPDYDPHDPRSRYIVQTRITVTPNARLDRATATLSLRDQFDAGTQLVLKSIPLTSLDAPSQQALHELEAFTEIAANGGHPNLVHCYDAFISQQELCMVLEDCAEGDLYDVLLQLPHSRMPQREALKVVLHLARALAFLHQLDIAHRDISIENVLVHRGQYKLCDFGLSTKAHNVCYDSVGKPYYMAPEVVDGHIAYNPVKADVWSLGMLFFILLTGSPLMPVAALDSPELVAFSHLGLRNILIHWRMAHLVSDPVQGLLEGMLQVDPAQRIASINEVLAHPAFWLATTPEAYIVGNEDYQYHCRVLRRAATFRHSSEGT